MAPRGRPVIAATKYAPAVASDAAARPPSGGRGYLSMRESLDARPAFTIRSGSKARGLHRGRAGCRSSTMTQNSFGLYRRCPGPRGQPKVARSVRGWPPNAGQWWSSAWTWCT